MDKRNSRVVVVTGASAGIGRATAVAFARRGWRVGLLARGLDGLEGARRQVEAVGGTALVVPTDVADVEQVEQAAARVEQELGPIDVWVNNAMATIFCDFLRTSPQDFRRATEVTYLGAVWGTRAALRRMHPRGRGTIVQVGSALAYRSIPLQSAYCAAKSALRGFTDSLRSELIHERSGVRLTMVQLSAFNTPQFDWGRTCMPGSPKPVGPVFQPEVAAEAIYQAALAPRRELWVGQPAVNAILGQRVIPGVLDRMLASQAWDGQIANEPRRTQGDNLHAPLPGDHGARGRFGAVAKSRSTQLWLNLNRSNVVMMASLAVLAVVAGSLASRR